VSSFSGFRFQSGLNGAQKEEEEKKQTTQDDEEEPIKVLETEDAFLP